MCRAVSVRSIAKPPAFKKTLSVQFADECDKLIFMAIDVFTNYQIDMYIFM